MALALGVVFYALIIVLRFPDYLEEALRPIAILYTSGIGDGFFDHTARLLALTLMPPVFAWAADKDRSLRHVALFCAGLSLLAWFGFAIQGKGVSAHMLPAMSLLLLTTFLTLTLHVKVYQKGSYRLTLATVTGIFLLGYLMFPPDPEWPTHSEMKRTTLAKYILKHAGKPGDSFYIMADDKGDIFFQTLSMYTGVTFASRFSTPWFCFGMIDLKQREGSIGESKKKEKRLKVLKYWHHVFAGYVAQDISRYKPVFIAIRKDLSTEKDFVKIFAMNPSFVREWTHYKKRDELYTNDNEYVGRNRDDYPGVGEQGYDVYYRVR
ncbi:MAG: hypothetical protein HY052_04995 [Proteobacteria bacterium]|nr:hypothetical protein [Pseudomonadota bacterium]